VFLLAPVSGPRRPSAAHSNALPRLGELELAVMEVLWVVPDCDAQTVRERLPAARRCSLSTVQSTLERLHRKALLSRRRERRAYLYRARLERAELLGRLLGGVIRQLHNGHLDPILSSFVDFADRMDERTLERLDELLQQRLRERESSLRQPTSGDHDD
jgi:predicted transcriptional regulator